MKTQTMTVPTVGGSQGFTATQSYAYDSLNRLQSATETVSGSQTWKQTFTFDRYGNRRFDVANTTTLGSCATAVCNPTIATSNNRFSTGQGYSYNANGDLTLDAEGKQFAYDAESRQTSFGTGGSNTNGGAYSYDGEGKRVKKITSTETTVFVYDAAGQLAAEYSTQTAQTPQVSYLTTDHLGSPRVITDANGAVTSRKDFAAFGDETITAQRTTGLGYNPPSVRQDYTGYQKDSESGLEYAQARYYNSSHGRFTSVDPLTASASIRNPQTFNRYTYALNSPYKFTDPLGLLVKKDTFGRTTADQVRSDTCSAEFSSCEGDAGNAGGGDTYYLVNRTTTYTVTSTVGTRQATFTVTVTEQLIVNAQGNVVDTGSPTASASTPVNTGATPYSALELSQIQNIAQTGAQRALAKGVNVGDFLGILQGESEFGMAKSGEGSAAKQSIVNPSQYSGGRARAANYGVAGYQSALEYNIDGSIDNVYFYAKNKAGGNLWQTLYIWNGNRTIENNGQEQRTNFANRVSAIINGIQANSKFGLRTYSYFQSRTVPKGFPLISSPCGVLSGCKQF